MEKFVLTCNDTIRALVREDVTVTAETLDDAWELAKKRFARKHKTRKEYIDITAVRRGA